MNQDFTNMENGEMVAKPWGSFTRYTLNEASTVKIITVKAGEATSLQSHKMRSEFWKVLKGDAEITIGKEKQQAKPGSEFFITPNTIHRLGAKTENTEILEIAFGNFDENDITRIEDKYGRVSATNFNQ